MWTDVLMLVVGRPGETETDYGFYLAFYLYGTGGDAHDRERRGALFSVLSTKAGHSSINVMFPSNDVVHILQQYLASNPYALRV